MSPFTPAMEGLLLHIQEYRQKYYKNKMLKGLILSSALLMSIYLLLNTLEYWGHFSTTGRGILLFGFIAIAFISTYHWLIQPLIHLYGLKKPITDEQAALQIGEYFPEVGDKLLNTLQLGNLSGKQSDLIEASIKQKSEQLLIVRFSDAIKFDENKKWLRYAIYPLGLIAAVLLINPKILTTSSERIIYFKKDFSDAPFSFLLHNQDLKAYRNENYKLEVSLQGDALPEDIYLIQNTTRFKLDKGSNQVFSYEFKNIQREVNFHFEAVGYKSDQYQIQLIERPSLLSFDVNLHFPAYLNKPSENIRNVGNLSIPEGTTVEWNFNTNYTNALGIQFEHDSTLYAANQIKSNQYAIRKTIKKETAYELRLKNEQSAHSDKISYFIHVIPDQHPIIHLENDQDTTLFNYLVMGGTINDDYGFSKLQLSYTIQRQNQKTPAVSKSLPIPFNKLVNNQTFFFQWYVDSLQLNPGDKIEYFTQVWDNDGVNGPKSTKSRMLQFTVPSKDLLDAAIKESEKETENQIQSALKKAKSLEKDLENLDNKLKTNTELDFKEQKQIEDVLKKREELIKELQSLQEKNQNTNDKQQQFNPQSPEVQNKLEQLQKLMNELTDKNTEKLYEELKKLLEQKQSDRISSLLEKLRNKEQNLEKELERTMNLFKQMQLEQKVDKLVDKLDELAEKQEELTEKTLQNDQSNEENKNDALQKEQESLKKEFEKSLEDKKEIEELSKELEQPVDMPEDLQKEVQQEMEDSKKALQSKQNKKASEAQKKATKGMKEMGKMMADAMDSAEMEAMEEDLDALRDILENLIRLSFDQEALMKNFKSVSLQDPRFIKLGQEQLKLKDDAKVVEDSLYALANRVTQIQSFVTREVNDMKLYITESVQNVKDRKLNVATSKQQFAMTSMNNLALMLSDVFKQMQEQMAMATPGSGKGKKGKGKGEGKGMGEMQEKLNGQIKELGSGKEGQGKNSEKLARMAAEQAAIRKMIQDLIESQKGTAAGKQFGEELKEIAKKMDENETDLVNKRITPELIKRNQELTMRLLESEKAMKEQDQDEQRKSETARQKPKDPPPAFEKYVRDKQKQTELLRTVPPTFSPFYKREADTYFKKYQSSN